MKPSTTKNGKRDDNRPENLEVWTGNHSDGQRVDDVVADAMRTLERYAPHMLIERSNEG